MIKRLPRPLGQGYMLIDCISIAHIPPRIFKGITVLLLFPTNFQFPSKNMRDYLISGIFFMNATKHPNQSTNQEQPYTSIEQDLNLSILTMSRPDKFPHAV